MQVDHLKILHWNIEGVESRIYGNKTEEAGFQSLVSKYYIIALTETHAGDEAKVSLPGYYTYSSIRPKHERAYKHSGGITISVKEYLKDSVSFIQSRSKDIVWLKLKREFYSMCKDIMLGIVYASPSNSSYTKGIENSVTIQPVWEVLKDELAIHRSTNRIMLMGDFNARTGQLYDCIMNDDDVFSPVPGNYFADSEIMPRTNCDNGVNEYGKLLTEICRMSNIRIINGRKLGDTFGKFTCHKYNGSSTVDYTIVDDSLFGTVQSFQVLDILENFSDHCPISTYLNIAVNKKMAKTNMNDCCNLKAPVNPKWGPVQELIFTSKLQSPALQEKINSIESVNILSINDIEKCVADVSEIISHAANIHTNN